MRYFTIEKGLGETPLQAAERGRIFHQLSVLTPLAYAGRLDPMATGKLLILVGEECKRQKEYHSLDKEYEFEVLHGFQSDTYDVMGLAEATSDALQRTSEDTLARWHGNIALPYPAFSSKTVNGVQLHQLSLSKHIDKKDLPTKTSRIYLLVKTGERTMHAKELLSQILNKLNSFPEITDSRKELGRDFRRKEIRARWHELLDNSHDTYTIESFRCICSSGTYMRSLANELGGLAFSIHRSKIGKYMRLPLVGGFWRKKF